MTDEEILDACEEISWNTNQQVQVADTPKIERVDDGSGAWVSALIWIPFE
jgi:hypothetical protein